MNISRIRASRTARTLAALSAASVLLLAGCSAGLNDPEDSAAPPTSATPAATDDSDNSGDSADSADGADGADSTDSADGADAADGADEEDDSAAANSNLPTVPGYAVGDFPPIPLIVLPDLSLLDDSLGGFAVELTELVGDYPGLTIAPATCDDSGTLQAGDGALLAYGDGSGTYTGPDGSSDNYGDGSGSFTLNGVNVEVYGDGSGSYDDGVTSIQNYGDGSGSYEDDEMDVQIYGDGSGSYTDADEAINNYGDGSGSFTGGGVSIDNYGDGSGSYTDGTLTISNWGDGTGNVNGADVEMEPLPPVPRLGVFPPMGTLAPIESCGTTITLESGLLFDIDSYEIRPEAADLIETVAQALTDGNVPTAQVNGHTDSVRSDDYNQTLSENRAGAVVDALEALGVATTLEAVGYGESMPVAPNELNGQDNPAGRQLNRRVEIFVPAF